MVRPEPQEGQGQSEVVVEVALGLEDPEAGGEQGGGEVLGRRLADAAGDADDLDRPPAEDLAGEGLERGHGVRDQDEAEAGGSVRDRAGDDRAGRARGGGGDDEVVPVALPGDGEEELAGRGQPGVDAEAVEGQGGGALEDGPAGRPGDVVEPEHGHGQTASFARRVSAATSRSLKCTVRSLKTW